MVRIPKDVQTKLDKLSTKFDLTEEEVKDEYLELYNAEHLDDEYEDDDEGRHSYTVRVLLSKYAGRKPFTDLIVIPIGHTGVRKTKTGSDMRSLYVRNSNKKITRILLFDKFTTLVEGISFPAKYKIKAALGDDGSISIDERTKFNNPNAIGSTILEILQKFTDIKTFNIGQIGNGDILSATKKTSTGEWADDTDWRHIRAIVSSSGSGIGKTGKEWGRLTVTDEAIDEIVLADGTVLQPRLNCWCDPIFTKHTRGSEVDVFGLLNKNEKKEVTMDVLFVQLKVLGRFDGE